MSGQLLHRPDAVRLPTALCLIIALSAGCSMTGDEYSDLEPGTFSLDGYGEVLTGQAAFYRYEDSNVIRARVYLPADPQRELVMVSDSLLDAEAGESLVPAVTYRTGETTFYNTSGALQITAVGDGFVDGTFRFRMKQRDPIGCIRCIETTVSGGFRARLEPDVP